MGDMPLILVVYCGLSLYGALGIVACAIIAEKTKDPRTLAIGSVLWPITLCIGLPLLLHWLCLFLRDVPSSLRQIARDLWSDKP